MGKHLNKQLHRLQLRVKSYNKGSYREEGTAKAKANGGFHVPGSMNHKKCRSLKP